MAEAGIDAELAILKSQDRKSTKKNKSKRKSKSDINTSDSNVETSKEAKIKPIIKNGSLNADLVDNSEDFSDNVYSYRKKRNKSVSFLIEDGEQVTKKTKSNSGKNETEQAQEKPNKKKHKKDKKSDSDNDLNEPVISKKKDKAHSKIFRNKSRHNSESVNSTEEAPVSTTEETLTEPEDENRKKKNKKRKKQNSVSEIVEDIEVEEHTEKGKSKNKKSHSKAEGDGVPVKKAKNNETLPETIADDLETLKIGDNPHSLTSLLDDMKVSDKTQKHKIKKNKKSKETTDDNEKSPNEDVKEKTKWKKRKWNKGRTGAFDNNWMETAVIVENLPLTCMLNYKNLLKEKFAGVGTIKSIGIAELYPTMVSKPVFTTTVQFTDEESATKALEEDNTLLENSRIRVLRPLEPNSTTIVVRSYGELNDQNLSSIFNGVGKIRNIRHLNKGKERRKMATTFIEFDGPDSQEKAIEVANGMKIGSKKLHVCKFQEQVKQHENRENVDQNIM